MSRICSSSHKHLLHQEKPTLFIDSSYTCYIETRVKIIRITSVHKRTILLMKYAQRLRLFVLLRSVLLLLIVMTYVVALQGKPTMAMKRSTHNPIMQDISKSETDPPTFAKLKDAGDAFTEHPPHIDTKLKDDENPTKPLSILSARDFEDMSQDMLRLFEGKETEQNWDRRRKSIIKISRITHGNAPLEFRAQYISFIKSQLDGILKVVDSLRTNVTTAGLNLLQHIADTLGHGVDFMVDFVAETLITRCCNTSKVKRDPAIATFESIISNATCNKNILHYIMSASEHKDPNARTAVSGWLIAVLTKNARHCDQAGILDLIEKCIKNGLNDAKPQVRTPMRATYGIYASFWPDRADRLRDSLDAKTQKMLDSNVTVEPAKSALKRPSIRDIKAAKKREMDAQENTRPDSSQANRPSIKDIKAAKIRDMKAKEIVRPPSAHSNKPSVRDAKSSKKRDGEGEEAAHPLSAHSNRSSVRETKTARKRDVEAEETLRPPSAHSNRSSARDHKTSRKRDAEADDIIRPPSAQSNNPSRTRDIGAQDSGRPTSAHPHTSTSERRFHILSSAPMRPQRTLVDLKRVIPKPAANPQQQAGSEPPTSHQSDDHRAAKLTDRRVHGPRGEARPPAKIDVSQLEHSRNNMTRTDTGHREIVTRIQDVAAPAVVAVEVARPGTGDSHVGSDSSAVPTDVEKRHEKHAESRRNGPTLLKHEKTQTEKRIEIHEDAASAVQEDRGLVLRVTKKRSGELTKEKSVQLDRVIGELTRKRSGELNKEITEVTKRISGELTRKGSGELTRKRSGELTRKRSGELNKEIGELTRKGSGDLTKARSGSLTKGTMELTRRGSGDLTRKRSGELNKEIGELTQRSEEVTRRGSAELGKGRSGSLTKATTEVTKRRSYEKLDHSRDGVKASSKKGSVRPPSPPTVLREIDQLNQTVESVKRQGNARQKYISTETAERNRSVSPHSRDPEKARKQLSRAIGRIRSRAMDDYGYRRLQGLIKVHDNLFQDEQKYEELLLALLDTLETPNTERRQPLGRQFDNKFQILVTIRLMLVHNAKYCAAYHARALSALITARRNFESRCHVVGGLEETADDIIAVCSPTDVLDPILDVLQLQEHDAAGYRATSIGLHILGGLVARIKGSEITDKIQEERLSRFALKCLRNENSETRRATIAFCIELRRLINPEKRYFQMVAGNDEALKSLLTYFIATTSRR